MARRCSFKLFPVVSGSAVTGLHQTRLPGDTRGRSGCISWGKRETAPGSGMGNAAELREVRRARNVRVVRAVHREKVNVNDVSLVPYYSPAFNYTLRSAAGREGYTFTASNSCLGVLITSGTLREA